MDMNTNINEMNGIDTFPDDPFNHHIIKIKKSKSHFDQNET